MYKKVNEDDEPLLELPRYDLRDKAFRKYEQVIAMACSATYIIPKDKYPKLVQHSLSCRVKDAILGKRRYGYKSDAISDHFDLSNLRVDELVDGSVRITNLLQKKQQSGNPSLQATDHEGIILSIKRMASREEPPGREVVFAHPDELKWLEQYEKDNQSLFFIHPNRFPNKVKIYA